MIEKRANVVRRMGILRRVAMQSGSRPMGDGVEAEIRAALNLHLTQPSPVQHGASKLRPNYIEGLNLTARLNTLSSPPRQKNVLVNQQSCQIPLIVE